MISLDVQTDSATLAPISLPKETKESALSFSELLHGKRSDKDHGDIQNGALVLSLGAKEPKEIQSLLPLTPSLVENKDTYILNPIISKESIIADLKITLVQAKTYLKDKIIQSDGFKRAEIQVLPKTLKGLIKMAKTFGVDISKVSLEEVQKTASKDTLVNTVDTLDIDNEDKKRPLLKTFDNEIKSKVENKKSMNIAIEDDIKSNIDDLGKKIQTTRDIKSTPLFTLKENSHFTTEQLVQTRYLRPQEKGGEKSRADETLKLLLNGKRPTQTSAVSTNITADFSVNTARVIAPQATTEVNKSLEQLLSGNPEDSLSKTDGLSTPKSDSFEVKLNEAKQMVKYLSQDVKSAIEDYKSPFTRVKVQLNPQKMGEVDVTIVSRGNNLHVNISSNTAAINTLAIHANELKAQLNNTGINNATLNFNNSSQQGEQQNTQQHKQNQEKAEKEYSYIDDEEHNEEILSSLEIVVPNYV